MRVVRFGEAARAPEIRALGQRDDLRSAVAAIIADVRAGGDAALLRLSREIDGVSPEPLRVTDEELAAALDGLDAAVRAGLAVAIENVERVSRAGLRDPIAVELPQGQLVEVVELPLRRAGVYAPGGRAAYPSSVVMCATAAVVGGVEELVVASPPRPDGRPHPTVLAACALCGVREVYAVGGAQAVAALAHGTETIGAVDVIAGPGNAYVTEAKRQLVGSVAIDGLAGPSELVVAAAGDAEAELVALDVLAQAEHGAASLTAVISADPALLEAVAAAVARLGPRRPSVADAALALVKAPGARAAVALADELAPEHLELVGAEVEALAGEVRAAGCLFVGRDGATAFGDYVAGSNHVLPTGGAARFASALSAATFRRRMARVSLPPGAAAALAPAGAAIARAEGFPVHAESMERRA